jgi:hypothetical protein
MPRTTFRLVSRPTRSLIVGMLLLVCLQSGCHSCWSIDDGCGPGMEFGGCGDGDAALFIGALYLALAIPYLIGEAWRSCQ